MNFAAGGDYIMVNTPGDAAGDGPGHPGARRASPEVEVFDTGHLVLVNELIDEGLIDDPAMIQLCMGIPYGAPDDPLTLMAMVNRLPHGLRCSRRSRSAGCRSRTSRWRRSSGGNVRVGLEDNLYLSRGVLATNGQLVERAVTMLEAMNVRVMTRREVRDKLGLVKRGMSRRVRPAAARSGLLGGGVIGGGWAARFLLNGVDVRMYDPDPEAAAEGRRGGRQRPPRLGAADDAPLPAEGTLDGRRLAEDGGRRRGVRAGERARARASSSASCWRRAEPAAAPDVVIASSTSGPAAAAAAGRHDPPGAAGGRATRSTPSTCCRWSRCAAASARQPGRRQRAAAVYRPSACDRWCCARRSTASSPTG